MDLWECFTSAFGRSDTGVGREGLACTLHSDSQMSFLRSGLGWPVKFFCTTLVHLNTVMLSVMEETIHKLLLQFGAWAFLKVS